MSTNSETDKDSGIAIRPLSEMLVDLHVYRIPNDHWLVERRLVKNHAIDYSISAGFIRVLPELSLQDVRKEIAYQLGYDVLPSEFVFLRSIGKNFAKVRSKQERQFKVKFYLPPFVTEPEIYLLKNPENLLASSSQSEIEIKDPIDKLNCSRRKPKRFYQQRRASSAKSIGRTSVILQDATIPLNNSITASRFPLLNPQEIPSLPFQLTEVNFISHVLMTPAKVRPDASGLADGRLLKGFQRSSSRGGDGEKREIMAASDAEEKKSDDVGEADTDITVSSWDSGVTDSPKNIRYIDDSHGNKRLRSFDVTIVKANKNSNQPSKSTRNNNNNNNNNNKKSVIMEKQTTLKNRSNVKFKHSVGKSDSEQKTQITDIESDALRIENMSNDGADINENQRKNSPSLEQSSKPSQISEDNTEEIDSNEITNKVQTSWSNGMSDATLPKPVCFDIPINDVTRQQNSTLNVKKERDIGGNGTDVRVSNEKQRRKNALENRSECNRKTIADNEEEASKEEDDERISKLPTKITVHNSDDKQPEMNDDCTVDAPENDWRRQPKVDIVSSSDDHLQTITDKVTTGQDIIDQTQLISTANDTEHADKILLDLNPNFNEETPLQNSILNLEVGECGSNWNLVRDGHQEKQPKSKQAHSNTENLSSKKTTNSKKLPVKSKLPKTANQISVDPKTGTVDGQTNSSNVDDQEQQTAKDLNDVNKANNLPTKSKFSQTSNEIPPENKISTGPKTKTFNAQTDSSNVDDQNMTNDEQATKNLNDASSANNFPAKSKLPKTSNKVSPENQTSIDPKIETANVQTNSLNVDDQNMKSEQHPTKDWKTFNKSNNLPAKSKLLKSSNKVSTANQMSTDPKIKTSNVQTNSLNADGQNITKEQQTTKDLNDVRKPNNLPAKSNLPKNSNETPPVNKKSIDSKTCKFNVQPNSSNVDDQDLTTEQQPTNDLNDVDSTDNLPAKSKLAKTSNKVSHSNKTSIDLKTGKFNVQTNSSNVDDQDLTIEKQATTGVNKVNGANNLPVNSKLLKTSNEISPANKILIGPKIETSDVQINSSTVDDQNMERQLTKDMNDVGSKNILVDFRENQIRDATEEIDDGLSEKNINVENKATFENKRPRNRMEDYSTIERPSRPPKLEARINGHWNNSKIPKYTRKSQSETREKQRQVVEQVSDAEQPNNGSINVSPRHRMLKYKSNHELNQMSPSRLPHYRNTTQPFTPIKRQPEAAALTAATPRRVRRQLSPDKTPIKLPPNRNGQLESRRNAINTVVPIKNDGNSGHQRENSLTRSNSKMTSPKKSFLTKSQSLSYIKHDPDRLNKNLSESGDLSTTSTDEILQLDLNQPNLASEITSVDKKSLKNSLKKSSSTTNASSRSSQNRPISNKVDHRLIKRRSLVVSIEDLPDWLWSSSKGRRQTGQLDEISSRRELLAVLRVLRARRRKAKRIYQDYMCYMSYLRDDQGGYGRIGLAVDMWKRKYGEELRETHIIRNQCQRLQQHLTVLRHQNSNKLPPTAPSDPSNIMSLKFTALKLVSEIEALSNNVEHAKIQVTAESKLKTQVAKEAKMLRAEVVDRKIDASIVRSQTQMHYT